MESIFHVNMFVRIKATAVANMLSQRRIAAENCTAETAVALESDLIRIKPFAVVAFEMKVPRLTNVGSVLLDVAEMHAALSAEEVPGLLLMRDQSGSVTSM